MRLFKKKSLVPAQGDAPLFAAPPSGQEADDVAFALGEAEQTISALRSDLERLRGQLADTQRGALSSDELAVEVGQPLAHLATQVALVLEGGSTLTEHDLAGTAADLIATLGEAGITLAGTVGASERFDPDHHLALHGAPAPGTFVILRSPAVIAPSGQVARLATVEPM